MMRRMSRSKASKPADVVREFGPFVEGAPVHGVSYDGEHVWVATGQQLHAIDPVHGSVARRLDTECDAGTAYDGKHLYQLAKGAIRKLDPRTGKLLATLPLAADGDSAGLTWAEGTLWLARYRARKILQIDPETGTILRTLDSNRFVTGVTWVDGQLWHGTMDEGVSELRQVDVDSGEVLASLVMPEGVHVSGLESDGGELFYCGGAASGKLRAVKRPRR